MATSKSTDHCVRFSFPTLAGVDQFRELVHVFGGAELVCKQLRIAPELLAAYMSGELEPPYSLMLAVYWHSPFGFSQAFSESHWTHAHNFRLRMNAEDQVQRYRAFLGRVAKLGLLDADQCMHLACEAGIEDAWPAQPLPDRLALVDEKTAAEERQRRRIKRLGDGSRKRRRAALPAWHSMQEQERVASAAEPIDRSKVLRGPRKQSRSQTCAG